MCGSKIRKSLIKIYNSLYWFILLVIVMQYTNIVEHTT